MPPPTLLVPSPETGETPVAYIQGWIRQRMAEFGGHAATLADRVLVVRAETGSGKSTVLPVSLFRILRAESTPPAQRFAKAGVVCTQPRVLTAVALARDVCAGRYPDMVLGRTVGYQTGPTSSQSGSGLTYVTAGTLAVQLRRLSDDELMGRYRIIIVDEAHERSIDTDMTLMLLRDFYWRNVGEPRLPFLLLASATIDPAAYAAYFGVGAANVVEVRGRGFPIKTHWPAAGFADYPRAAADLVLQIHRENPDDPPEQADILVFVPGAAEALSVARILKTFVGGQPDAPAKVKGARGGKGKHKNRKPNAESLKDLVVSKPKPSIGDAVITRGQAPFLLLVINRDVVNSQTGDYSLIFAPPSQLRVGGRRPARRVIVSTTVAETGLTIDTLKYVVDCGWSRTVESYQPWRATGLTTRPAPRSRIAQRRGRVGRLFPGEFYPLYTERVFEALDADQLPDIITGNSALVFISLVASQQRQKLAQGQFPEFRVEDITLLDPPPPEALLGAIRGATALGLLAPLVDLPAGAKATMRGYGLTALGWVAARFTFGSMESIRVLLAGYVWGSAASDLLTAVAMFGRPMDDLYLRRRGGRGQGQGQGGRGQGRGQELGRGQGRGQELGQGQGQGQGQELGQNQSGQLGATAALAAAAPPHLWSRSVAKGELAISDASFLRTRLLLADDFAEAVLIYDAFLAQVALTEGDLGAVDSWCRGLGLRMSALLELAGTRERLADEMVAAGLDPFRAAGARLAAVAAEEFTPALCRLKRCLFDGLQMNLLRFAPDHPAGPGYVTHHHRPSLRVRCPVLYTDAMADRLADMRVAGAGDRPRWIVTDQVRLVAAPKSGAEPAPVMYSVEANHVCVLDGYVTFDPDTERAFEPE